MILLNEIYGYYGNLTLKNYINATIRVYTFGNLKMYKIDSSVIMILR